MGFWPGNANGRSEARLKKNYENFVGAFPAARQAVKQDACLERFFLVQDKN
jgi:hypothetical protein